MPKTVKLLPGNKAGTPATQSTKTPKAGARTLFTKDFTILALGQIISLFGNQIVRYALPLYLLNLTGSSALFGTVLAFSFVPMLLLFPVGGVLADRLDKRGIMVALDFGTAAIILLFYLLAASFSIVPLVGITLVLLYAIQGAYQPAVKASVPLLVHEANMMRGNAVVDLINSLAGMAGPVLGGVLFSLVGLTPILYISAACFFVSSVMELFLRIPHTKRAVEGSILHTGVSDIRESFRFLLYGQPALLKLSPVYAAMNLLLTALVLIALPVLITQRLGFAPASANRLYGYAQGVLAGGSILGGVLAGALGGRLRLSRGPVLLGGACFAILMAGAALHWLSAPMAVYLLLVSGAGALTALSTLLQIQVVAYMQRVTPPQLTGRVLACFMCIAMCTNPLGQLLYGFVFERVGTHTYLPFYAAGLAMVAVGLLARGMFRGPDVNEA